MHVRLCAYEDLNADQCVQLRNIEVLPEQIPFSGDIVCALYSLPAKPHPGIKGLVLLKNEQPVAFMLIKRYPLLSHWAETDCATLHALQVDKRAQGQGLGKVCLRLLVHTLNQHWPEIRTVMLSVSPNNRSALAFYLSQGWHVSGEAYRGELRLEFPLTSCQAKPAA